MTTIFNMSVVDFVPHVRDYIRNFGVSNIHSPIDFWDETRGFPGGIKMRPYNFIVSITPRPLGDQLMSPSSFCPNGKYNPYVWRDKSFDIFMPTKGNKRNENGELVRHAFHVMDVWYGFHLPLYPESKRGIIRGHFVSMKMIENDHRNGLVRIVNDDLILVKGRMMYPTVMHFQTIMEDASIGSLYESHKLPVFLAKSMIVQKEKHEQGYVLSTSDRYGSRLIPIGSIGGPSRALVFYQAPSLERPAIGLDEEDRRNHVRRRIAN